MNEKMKKQSTNISKIKKTNKNLKWIEKLNKYYEHDYIIKK